jgi:hypothetical protein
MPATKCALQAGKPFPIDTGIVLGHASGFLCLTDFHLTEIVAK